MDAEWPEARSKFNEDTSIFNLFNLSNPRFLSCLCVQGTHLFNGFFRSSSNQLGGWPVGPKTSWLDGRSDGGIDGGSDGRRDGRRDGGIDGGSDGGSDGGKAGC